MLFQIKNDDYMSKQILQQLNNNPKTRILLKQIPENFFRQNNDKK